MRCPSMRTSFGRYISLFITQEKISREPLKMRQGNLNNMVICFVVPSSMDYVSSKSFESDSDPKCSHSLDQFAQHCHTCDAIQHAWCLHGRERCEMLATDSYFWRVKARVQLSMARDRYPIIAWSRPIGQALQVPGPTNRIEVNSAPPFSKADVNTIP